MTRQPSTIENRPRSGLLRVFDPDVVFSEKALLVYLGVVGFLVHVLFAENYGYFRDELYYIVSGQHLQLGYVDFPPLIAYVAALLNLLGGDSLFAIHVFSGLVFGVVIVVTGLIARELGGGRRAQLMAASATLLSGGLALGSLFSPDVLDALWWSLCALVYVRIVRRNEPRLWLVLGLFAGLGLMTKLTILFFLLALLAGLVVTPSRRYLRSGYFWAGALLAVLFLVPYVIWNWQNGWPTVDFYVHHGGLNGSGPVAFLVLQVLIVNPVNLPLAIVGLLVYLRRRVGRPYRVLGLAYLFLLVLFTAINAKPYFLGASYPLLFAAGALSFQNLAGSIRRVLAGAYLTSLIVVTVFLAPLLMPVLPPPVYAQTYGNLSFLGNGATAQGNAGIFPQYLGDRFGWDTMTLTVSSVYHGLSPGLQSQTCVFASNYGEASALTFLGQRYGLPPVVSGHNNFYFWGPGSCTGQVIITVGLSAADVEKYYGNVTQAAVITCQYCMNYENNLPVYLATEPTVPLQELWSSVKTFS